MRKRLANFEFPSEVDSVLSGYLKGPGRDARQATWGTSRGGRSANGVLLDTNSYVAKLPGLVGEEIVCGGNGTMAEMRHEFGSVGEPGVLAPTVPADIGARSQRQRILEAMASGCAEKTFAATTIADIVTRASISRATFYKHFKNKRECFEAAVEAVAEEIEGIAAGELRKASSPTEALFNAVAAVLEMLARNPAKAKLFVVEAPTVDPALIGRYRQRVLEGLTAQWNNGHAGSDPRIAFGRAQVLMASYVAHEQIDKLPELQRELVYVALLPFVGQETALQHASLGK